MRLEVGKWQQELQFPFSNEGSEEFRTYSTPIKAKEVVIINFNENILTWFVFVFFSYFLTSFCVSLECLGIVSGVDSSFHTINLV